VAAPDAAALAVGSSLTGGVSDYLAGTGSRRVGTLRFMFWTQLLQTILAAAWVAISGEPLPGLGTLAVAGAASLGLTVGLTAFVQAMVVGTISIVAPLSATGVMIPVIAGIVIDGAHPGPRQVGGIVLTIAGSVLVARAGDRGTAARAGGRGAAAQSGWGIGLAGVAALGTGIFFWLVAPASRHSLIWTVLIVRLVPVAVLGMVLAVQGAIGLPRVGRRETLGMVASGLLAFAGLALYAGATVRGELVIVSVLGSLYPAVTVLLAQRLLGEHLEPVRRVGLVAVLAGVVLLSASTGS
jgi:uncharacterized membrane protein